MAGKFRDKLIVCKYFVTVMFSKTVIICTSLSSSLYNLSRKQREERKEVLVSLTALGKDLIVDAVVRSRTTKA